MAVRAPLRFSLTDRMRKVRSEGLAAESCCRDGRLLDVDMLAIGVLGAQYQCARGPHGRDQNVVLAAPPDSAMDPQDELIIPGDLRVIGRPVPGFFAFIMGRHLLPLRSDREMASRASRGPGEMAGEASHALVGMCQLLVIRRHLP